MQAAVFEGPGHLVLKEVAQPVLRRPDHVRLQVEAVGICGTDVHITSDPPGYAATPGVILGHEFVGRVAEVGGDVTHVVVGDRVVVNPNLSCGVCSACASLRPNLCANIRAVGIDEDGAFAAQWVGASRLCYRISGAVTPAAGAFGEMLADVVNGINRASIRPGQSAAVIGLGPIGHLFAQVLSHSGADPVFLIDRAPYRLDAARRLGWKNVVDTGISVEMEELRRRTNGGPDLIVDAVGSVLGAAIDLVGRGGTVVVFGVNTRAQTEISQSLITTKELKVIGTWLAPGSFPDAVRLLESGALALEPLVSHRLPLAAVHEGLELLRSQQALKVLIQP